MAESRTVRSRRATDRFGWASAIAMVAWLFVGPPVAFVLALTTSAVAALVAAALWAVDVAVLFVGDR